MSTGRGCSSQHWTNKEQKSFQHWTDKENVQTGQRSSQQFTQQQQTQYGQRQQQKKRGAGNSSYEEHYKPPQPSRSKGRGGFGGSSNKQPAGSSVIRSKISVPQPAAQAGSYENHVAMGTSIARAIEPSKVCWGSHLLIQ